MIIDAKRALKPNHIQSFVKDLQDDTDIDIVVNNEVLFDTIKVKDFRKAFENERLEELIKSDDDEISFVASDSMLTIAGIDYKWWIEPVRNKKYKRLDKLFSTEQSTTEAKVKTERVAKTTNVAVADLVDNIGIQNIKTFSGTIRDVISFMNKEYAQRELRSRFAGNTVFYLNYEDEQALNFSSYKDCWKTIEQLQEEGVIEL